MTSRWLLRSGLAWSPVSGMLAPARFCTTGFWSSLDSLSDQPVDEALVVLDTLAGEFVELERMGRADGWIAMISLVGHADVTGTEELNFDLSARRAEKVRDALVRRGMAEDDLRVIGAGSTQPLTGVDDLPWGSDRRVEVEVELVAVSEDGRG